MTKSKLSRPEPIHSRTEHRPLLDLIVSQEVPAIDVAALSYLPGGISELEQAAFQQWSGDAPVLTHIVDTPFGRIGLFALPIAADALYGERERLQRLSWQAIALARSAGARIVALTGLLSSATNYGHAFASLLGDQTMPVVTTGHATTTAAVVLNIQELLAQAGRNLAQESVSFVGLGSIGRATLQLMLRVLPHPRSLLICDLYTRQRDLEEIGASLKREGTGKVIVAQARAGRVPEEVYQTTTLVGATNVPEVVDIWRLPSGCLVVDDSAPHCFSIEQALRRIEQRGDILVTEGGELSTPWNLSELCYLPYASEAIGGLMQSEELFALRDKPNDIMGCLLSAALSHGLAVPTTLGHVDMSVSLQHFEALRKCGVSGALPHLGHVKLRDAIIRFRGLSGKPETGAGCKVMEAA